MQIPSITTTHTIILRSMYVLDRERDALHISKQSLRGEFLEVSESALISWS